MRAFIQVLATSVAPRLSICALLLLQSPVQAQTASPPLPVSIDRIRAALQQPPPLQLPAPSSDMPTFRLEIQQPLFVFSPPDEKPFDPTFGLPSIGDLVMGGIGKIASTAAEHKHARAQRRARKEVDEALAAFCAVHDCSASAPGK